MFSVLRKFDFCFASLLSGEDVDTKETLPGFENGVKGVMTKTYMVRCKGIVERTRVAVIDVMEKQTAPEQADQDDEDLTNSETDFDTDADATDASAADRGFIDPNWGDDDNELLVDVARVYEKTLIQLGEALQDSILP